MIAADLLLVGPDRLHGRGLDRRRDHLLVDGVEVDRAAWSSGFVPKRHQDEAEGLVRQRLLPRQAPNVASCFPQLEVDHAALTDDHLAPSWRSTSLARAGVTL